MKQHKGECHVVVLQDYPDPDAISSALAHKLICETFDIEVDILYQGEISHQQNVALVRLLEIDLVNFRDSKDLTQYEGAIFVDNQGNTSDEILKALEDHNVPVVMVIDHHEKQERLNPEFSDIRRIGATATIYAQYLQGGILELDSTQEEHKRVATALTHGIMTDTNNFVRAGSEDFEAAAYLSQYRDGDLLANIMNQARSKQTMDVIYKALGNRTVVESYSISGIGYLRASDRDAIPQAADFLITEENIHTAIVYGIVRADNEEEILSGSMRTLKVTLDPDKFLKEVFGKSVSGEYYGGGKQYAGGFEIPVGFLSGNHDPSGEFESLKWEVYNRQIQEKLFDKIGVEKEDDEE